MTGADAIARILKQEGVDFMGVIPMNTLEEAGAVLGVRPMIFRQERVGVNLADGYSRVTNGRGVGVFSMQAGPGAENAFAGVAQAYADSVPILLLPCVGYEEQGRGTSHVQSESAATPRSPSGPSRSTWSSASRR